MAAIQAGERSRARTTVASTVELFAQEGLPESLQDGASVERKGERRNVEDDNGERQGRKEKRDRERGAVVAAPQEERKARRLEKRGLG